MSDADRLVSWMLSPYKRVWKVSENVLYMTLRPSRPSDWEGSSIMAERLFNEAPRAHVGPVGPIIRTSVFKLAKSIFHASTLECSGSLLRTIIELCVPLLLQF